MDTPGTPRSLLENRPDIHESRILQTENILSSLRSSLNNRTAFRRSYHDPEDYIQGANGEQQILSPKKSPLGWPLPNSPFPKEWNDPNSNLPPFDRSLSTRQAAIAVLGIPALVAAGCFGYSIFVYVARPQDQIQRINLGTAGRLVATLGLIAFTTLITDQLSYVHNTCLRWALHSEGRLEFNSNIRLFTSSRHSWTNRWFANVLWIVFLVISLAAASQLFIQFWDPNQQTFVHEPAAVDVTALFALGIGLFGQAALGLLCILQRIPTWSANPLNTTLAALHAGTPHLPGRCMLPVHDRLAKSGAYKPSRRQASAWTARRSVRWVLTSVWVLALISLAPILAWAIVERVQDRKTTVSLVNTPLGFFISRSQNTPIPSFHTVVQAILALLVFCGLQGLQIVALQCAELLVGMDRDESTWRRAAVSISKIGSKQRTSKGASHQRNPIISAATTWQSIVFFAIKVALYFLLSQTVALASVPAADINQINIHSSAPSDPTPRTLAFIVRLPFTLSYCGSALLLASFITFLAFWRPRGPQPAAFGHIQTLADLIDDWSTDDEGRFWWGEKSLNRDGTRHAGTSSDREELADVQVDALYA